MRLQPITALLDANTLYPDPVRDILLHLADVRLFTPKWTEQIHDEWIRSLLSNRPALKLKNLSAHFPQTYLNSFFVGVINPDDFIVNLVCLKSNLVSLEKKVMETGELFC